jgi:oligoribonuclease (3'-5' exoribonuclease)
VTVFQLVLTPACFTMLGVTCRRWRPRLYRQAPRKVAAHTAMSDIKESLKELQYYKSVLFRGK